MTRLLPVLSLALLVGACSPPPPPPAPEPPPPSTAVRDSIRIPFNFAKDNLTKSLEMVPENRLSFRATPAVRTFAELFGHVADSNLMICSAAKGEQGPAGTAEKTAKTKADLQKALADSFAYCEGAFDAVNDQTGAQPASLSFLPMPSTKLGLLVFVTSHQWEHYGNVVTYLRLNKMVPPSSQTQPPAGGA
jgi:uncharacterized damage-inducible protein DinB